MQFDTVQHLDLLHGITVGDFSGLSIGINRVVSFSSLGISISSSPFQTHFTESTIGRRKRRSATKLSGLDTTTVENHLLSSTGFPPLADKVSDKLERSANPIPTPIYLAGSVARQTPWKDIPPGYPAYNRNPLYLSNTPESENFPPHVLPKKTN